MVLLGSSPVLLSQQLRQHEVSSEMMDVLYDIVTHKPEPTGTSRQALKRKAASDVCPGRLGSTAAFIAIVTLGWSRRDCAGLLPDARAYSNTAWARHRWWWRW